MAANDDVEISAEEYEELLRLAGKRCSLLVCVLSDHLFRTKLAVTSKFHDVRHSPAAEPATKSARPSPAAPSNPFGGLFGG